MLWIYIYWIWIFFIKEDFIVFDTKYIWRGIIFYPFSRLYREIILNMKEDLQYLKKGKNYLYDDRLNNNEIIEINDNWSFKLDNNILNILIY